ncbi:MAG: hypothetical protein AAB654_00565, partial [Acidobacteriota bacterium]
MSTPVQDEHYQTLQTAILDGQVVPFLGAGANLCGRPREIAWQPEQCQFLPSGRELAAHLAAHFHYPAAAPPDLLRVAQFVAVMLGTG